MKVLLQDIKKLEAEAVIVGIYEDVRPLTGLAGELDWLLCGSLSAILLERRINGSLGDVALLTSQRKIPAQKIFMIGLGERAGFDASALRAAVRNAASAAVGAGISRAVLAFTHGDDLFAQEEPVQTIQDGLSEGAGGRMLDMSLLAADAASYEKLARSAKA
ncbi:MAG: hypothetical protein A2X56_00575 [Nitrospirae bacterium GWC2_57_13]|nr:MAG: hypothetical protein A2072_05235 [Nitrospirae bacterium GWC1_57_7]OGW28668.1 MAG: hypothetical protein A2X56_00575 [Nitrospirae bacterium GWC2_57_13]OGW44016.1 MAG: hypothetical protein A2X57_08210 [Nitrospirae bacterium GWD2_57_8]